MRYSELVECLGGESAEVWHIHTRAMEARARGESVVAMSVGDSDFDTPVAITDAAVAAMRGGDTHYTPIAGRPRLRSAIAKYHAKRWDLVVEPENVVANAGCQSALFAAARLILSPGDEVIVLEPMYVTYQATFRATGATIVPVACPSANGFRPDLAALRSAVSDRTRAITYATPVNPTGVMLTLDDLEAIADVARQHDLWVLSDEVYGEMTFGNTHVSIATLPSMAERCVTVGSLSKTHAMTGWRAGWAIGPKDFAAHMERLLLCSTYGQPGFIQEAAAFALESEVAEVEMMRETFRKRRDLTLRELGKAPGLNCFEPQAGMFMVIDVRGTGLDAAGFVDQLFEAERVALLDGAAFGPSTAGTVRLCFAIGDAELAEGCRRIVRFAQRLHQRAAQPEGDATAGGARP